MLNLTQMLADEAVSYISRKGGSQHIPKMIPTSKLEDLANVVVQQVFSGQTYGAPSKLAPIVWGTKFPGYFSSAGKATGASTVEKKEITAFSTVDSNISAGRGPGAEQAAGTPAEALAAQVAASARRPLVRGRGRPRGMKKLIGRGIGGIKKNVKLIRAIPNLTGKQAFGGAWKGGQKAPPPFL